MSGNTATDGEGRITCAVECNSNSSSSNPEIVRTLPSKRSQDETLGSQDDNSRKRAKKLQSNKRAHVSSELGSAKKQRHSKHFLGQHEDDAPTVSQLKSDTMVATDVDNIDNEDLFTGTSTASSDMAEHQPTRIADKFRNSAINDLFILEICAGSARLTKAARNQGFKGLAFDHSDNRSCGIEICNIELADPQQLQDLLEFITVEAHRIAAIWIAPSCGTASRARERPLPGQVSGPKPLRSSNQPDQLDGLSGVDKLKVEKANQLYDSVSVIALRADSLDICVGIENPSNARFWDTTRIQSLRAKLGENFVKFHNCAHGGKRDKLTSVWQSQHVFDSLQLFCDRKHPHDPWRP